MDIYAKTTGTDKVALKGFADAASAAAHGYSPYREEAMPAEPPGGGKTWHPVYVVTGGAIVREWEARDIVAPPRTFRRSYLAQWIRAHGKWDALQALLGQSADLAFLWEYSTEFDEDHAQWPEALAAVKAALGLTDAESEEMLAASAAD
jgi:hypothetical protein